MSNESLLESIREFVVSRGFEIVAQDTSSGADSFAEESFAVRNASTGAAFFVSVSPMSA